MSLNIEVGTKIQVASGASSFWGTVIDFDNESVTYNYQHEQCRTGRSALSSAIALRVSVLSIVIRCIVQLSVLISRG